MDHILEFSRPVTADKIGVGVVFLECKAKEYELTSLVERFGLFSLESMMFSLKFKRSESTGIIEAVGRLAAVGSQKCVVTLEPVKFELNHPISWKFDVKPAGVRETDFGIDMLEAAELIENNQIDFGELAAQQLAIMLDPYPRKPGAKIPPDGLWFGSNNENDDENRPFGALHRLKR